jgi:hypothetical protein
MLIADLISDVRRDLGDPPQNFQTNSLCDGLTTWFDLPKVNINPVGLSVQVILGASNTTLNLGPDYSLDTENGQLLLTAAPGNGSILLVTGTSWSLFTDEDLTPLMYDAVFQHCFGQTITKRFRDRNGFITYNDMPKTLDNLPRMEQPLVTTLALIDVLWVLATDTSTDIDIHTAEGTQIDRGERYEQLMKHINALTERYQMWCGELNVGMFRSETLNLRRVSRWTGRLVPLFRDREYDDHRWPIRELPQIDRRDEDNSGIPSPLWQSSGP